MRLAVLAVLLTGCGAPHLATQRALAAGIGAGAAAGGAALAACARGFDETCQTVLPYSLGGALLTGLSAGAALFLLETQDEAEAPSAR